MSLGGSLLPVTPDVWRGSERNFTEILRLQLANPNHLRANPIYPDLDYMHMLLAGSMLEYWTEAGGSTTGFKMGRESNMVTAIGVDDMGNVWTGHQKV